MFSNFEDVHLVQKKILANIILQLYSIKTALDFYKSYLNHYAICRRESISFHPETTEFFEYLPNKSLGLILRQAKKSPEWNGTFKMKTVFGIALAMPPLHNFNKDYILFDKLWNQKIFHQYLLPQSMFKVFGAYIPPEIYSE